MIQLLIALAILAILYFTLPSGNETVEEKPEETNEVHYERQTGIVKDELKQSMQQAADQRMREMERQINGN